MTTNGQVEWAVAVGDCPKRRRVAADVVFAKVHIDRCKVCSQDVTVIGLVPIEGWKFSRSGISVVMTLIVNGLKFLIQIKVVCDICKNHKSAGWPAALLTLSRQQD